MTIEIEGQKIDESDITGWCGNCGKRMIWKDDTKAWECPYYREDKHNHGFRLPDQPSELQ